MRLAIVLAALLIGLPAAAQESGLDKVYACSETKDPTARLACFDRTVAGLRSKQLAGDVAVVSRADLQKAETEAFGRVGPAPSALAVAAAPPTAPKPKPLDRVVLSVKSVEQGADKRMRFVMENGEVWRQTDDIHWPKLGQGPWTAEIRRAALGSFFLKLSSGGLSVRVERMD